MSTEQPAAMAANEKDSLLEYYSFPIDVESGTFKKTKAKYFPKWYSLTFGVIIFFIFTFWFKSTIIEILPAPISTMALTFNPLILLAELLPSAVVEVFEVKSPVSIPLGSYSSDIPFFADEILSESIVFQYEVPESFNFTGVLFTLNFTSKDNQDPIIAEVTVDNFPMWRTSSPHTSIPGAIAHSSTTKNVTEYLSIFQSNRNISVNIIDGKSSSLTVSLEAKFYNDALLSPIESMIGTPIDIKSIFQIAKPADRVISLSNNGLPFQVPQEKFTVSIPPVNKNSTIARLSLLASAAEDEVRWFKNKLATLPDDSTNIGPLRYINIFINDIFITAVSPKPTLLHPDKVGSKIDSSTAWSPVADSGAFDALAYDIDLTAVIPLLIENGATLDIQVVSPVTHITKSSIPGSPQIIPQIPGPVTRFQTAIPSRWDLSGNLLVWESDKVLNGIGAIIESDSLQKNSGIMIEPPSGLSLNQISSSKIDSGIVSELNLTLIDNSKVTLTLTSNSSSHIFSTLNEKMAGSTSNLKFIGGGKTELTIVDNDSGLSVLTTYSSVEFPFSIKESVIATPAPPIWGSPTTNELKVETTYSQLKKVDGKASEIIHSKERVLITDLSVSTEVQFSQFNGFSALPFSRDVKVIDGTIVKDTSLDTIVQDVVGEFEALAETIVLVTEALE